MDTVRIGELLTNFNVTPQQVQESFDKLSEELPTANLENPAEVIDRLCRDRSIMLSLLVHYRERIEILEGDEERTRHRSLNNARTLRFLQVMTVTALGCVAIASCWDVQFDAGGLSGGSFHGDRAHSMIMAVGTGVGAIAIGLRDRIKKLLGP